jgi:hypothetical protein
MDRHRLGMQTKCRLLCLSQSNPEAYWEVCQTAWTQNPAHIQHASLETLYNLRILHSYDRLTGCLDVNETVLGYLHEQAQVGH